MQTATVVIDGKKQKIRVSAAGLRTLRKNAKAQKAEVAAPAVEESK